MMAVIDWQDLAALGVVAMAVAYLARLGLGAISNRPGKGGGCGSSCGSCPVGPTPSSNGNGTGGPLVTIGPPQVPPRRETS